MSKFKKITALIISLMMTFSLFPAGISANEIVSENVLAFPGVEGGGKYSKGARGSQNIEIYHVTNLKDDGSEGSLRNALSKEGRIVVFDLDGVIKLNSTLRIPSNTTILAQTAPGEGITITNYDVQLENGAKDVIIRYLKVRPTDKSGDEPDGLGGQFATRIVFDHCSVSWGVDELLTLYAGSYESVKESEGKPHGSYYTVSNSISSESLRMSSHFKGAHGYGAIFGADVASYHHNLLAHHDSRSPRLDREMNGTEVINNIIYDWGQTNSAYGGEPYSMHNKSQNPTNVNYVNNYYNYGASTKSSIRSRIFQFENKYPNECKGNYYISGNYVYGNPNVTNDNLSSENSTFPDNTKGGLKNKEYANLLSTPFDLGEYQITPDTAQEAYNKVLKNVGATLPKRDAIDARIINDVKNLTGRVINNTTEVSGEIDLNMETTEKRVFSVPQNWITQKGLDSYNENDIISNGEYKGYTLIEAYVNEWTDLQDSPTNADITVISPSTAGLNKTVNGYNVNNGEWAVISENEKINYHAVAIPVSGTTIEKFELYDGEKLIKDYGKVTEINDSISLSAGNHYLSSRVYNSKGEKTQSTEAIVYVKKTGGDLGEFTFKEIGSPKRFSGKGGAYKDENGNYTLYGSGATGAMSTSIAPGTETDPKYIASNSADSFSYLYKAVKGNFDIRVKVDSIPKFENQQINGLMFRESLEPKARMAMITDSWLKLGENERILIRDTANQKSYAKYFKDKSGAVLENNESKSLYYKNDPSPYMRIVRYGDEVYLYVSKDGQDWTNGTRRPYHLTYNNLPETVYIGYATDSADTISTIPYFAISEFSDLTIIEGSEVTDPSKDEPKEPEPYIPEKNVDSSTANGFCYEKSFLMADKESGGKWIISSDGNKTLCYEDIENIEGNNTQKIVLKDKAVQIEIPEKYQTGKYRIDFDFLTDNADAAGRSFRVYMDSEIHPYDTETGQAKEMGTDNAFVHITDLKNVVYNTIDIADIGAKVKNDSMKELFTLTANNWYHYTITGTNGKDDLTLTVYKHGKDGQYSPNNLSEPVYSGKLSCTTDRNSVFKQLKFMHTANGTLYFDNIAFANLDVQLPDESTTETTTETITETSNNYNLGDVDNDNKITAKDAAFVLEYVLKTISVPNKTDFEILADVDNDKEITVNDAVQILKKVLDFSHIYTTNR